MKKDHETPYKFKAADFYTLLEKQEYRCSLTGRELTPENCIAAHIVPLRRGGVHEPDNIYLIVDEAAQIKRSLMDSELLELCRDILTNLESKDGRKIPKSHRKREKR